MDPQAPNNQPNSQDLSFQVMPQDTGGGNFGQPPAPASAPTASKAPVAPPPPSGPGEAPMHSPLSYEPEPSFFRTWKFYAVIAVAAALVLGVAGWFLFGSEKPDSDQQPVTKLPKVWLKQYFDKEVCDDQGICGDEADPDSDGLKNYDEFKTGTSPVNNDSDIDGLADGDELFIFRTEATLKYTDRRDIVAQNNWTDGLQIKNGYDPLTPGLKFTDLRNQQIEADKARLSFHEPTITTLGEQSTDASSSTKIYSNTKYGYEFQYDASLNLLEFSEAGSESMQVASPTSSSVGLKQGPGFIFTLMVAPFASVSSANIASVFTVNQPTDYVVSTAQVNGQTASKVVFKDSVAGVTSDFYFIEKSGKVFEVVVAKNNNLSAQTLSTLKFSN